MRGHVSGWIILFLGAALLAFRCWVLPGVAGNIARQQGAMVGRVLGKRAGQAVAQHYEFGARLGLAVAGWSFVALGCSLLTGLVQLR